MHQGDAVMTDLLTRLESGVGPDKALDGEVWCKTRGYQFVTWDGAGAVYRDPNAPKWDQGIKHRDAGGIAPYTSSIDAALSLVERMLPAWQFTISHDGAYVSRSDPPSIEWGRAKTPARSLTAALLRALDQEPRHESR
jgi:hypothetical protein